LRRCCDWTSRKKLSDAELAALLHDPRLEVHVLMAEGVPAGFAELDRRIEGEIELVQFGLMPEFIGQGLGRYFLQLTIGLVGTLTAADRRHGSSWARQTRPKPPSPRSLSSRERPSRCGTTSARGALDPEAWEGRGLLPPPSSAGPVVLSVPVPRHRRGQPEQWKARPRRR
jgi:hypothetical protein